MNVTMSFPKVTAQQLAAIQTGIEVGTFKTKHTKTDCVSIASVLLNESGRNQYTVVLEITATFDKGGIGDLKSTVTSIEPLQKIFKILEIFPKGEGFTELK